MEGGDANNSWIRRAKFSHTIYHRVGSSKFPLLIDPLSFKNDRLPIVSKSKSDASLAFTVQLVREQLPSLHSKSISPPAQILRNKHRTVSPVPQTKLSDAFKEARSDRQRFSTPHPQRKQSDHKFKLSPKKDSSWNKYFDHGIGRVASVGTSDEFKLDFSKLYIGKKFAHGAHSQLHQGSYMGQSIAVKMTQVPLNHHEDGEDEYEDETEPSLSARLENQYNREVKILSHLHHQNVIKFIAAGRRTPVFYIITEYLPEGSLRSYLHKLEQNKESLPLQKLIGIGLDIARGMEYIHSQGIIHRDLKPENVLITKDFHMEVADFGIACEGSSQYVLSDDPGTYRWMAPEMIKRKPYGRKVDVYSFGLILWEMVAGTIPYQHMTPIQAAFAAVNKNVRPDMPGDCPAPMRALIEQSWSMQPEKRPEFWQIVKVLEQFETSLAHDGILAPLINQTCQDHKKGLLRWIQKLGATRSGGLPVQKSRLSQS
ncbi:serine/threonine/tyrosine-protein kinase HT1-like [Impatiens glandulifera]|uniref:serine/threonine/tyrosine-protein kinase HT1-like n=1 Tax=Impatiens glandulifera TaxID=253017 RepID=UPI001FB182EF|nr:serine/threonine/tyrosine-protein kinase HT1-like [Impatiens glandulifera]